MMLLSHQISPRANGMMNGMAHPVIVDWTMFEDNTLHSPIQYSRLAVAFSSVVPEQRYTRFINFTVLPPPSSSWMRKAWSGHKLVLRMVSLHHQLMVTMVVPMYISPRNQGNSSRSSHVATIIAATNGICQFTISLCSIIHTAIT